MFGCLALKISVVDLLRKPRLQVALDLLSVDEALRIAKEAWNNGAEILEAGTPLIKKEGMRAVRVLREKFPEAIIVADMKTMDVGGLETKIAHDAGADIVTVLAVASDATILEALEYARKHGVLVMADLISHPNPEARVLELLEMDVDILGVHLGIDVQKKLGISASSKATIEITRRIRKLFKKPIAVAGGLKPGKIAPLVKAGANIIIVGSAITKSPNPGDVVSEILKELKNV